MTTDDPGKDDIYDDSYNSMTLDALSWAQTSAKAVGLFTALVQVSVDAWPRPSEKNAQICVRQLSLDLRQTAEDWQLEQRLPWGDFGYADYFRSAKNDWHRIMVRISE